MGKSTSRNSPAIPPCRRCPHESRSPQTNPRSNHWAPATTPAAPPTTNTTTGPLFLPPHLARPKTHFTWIHSLQTPAMGNLCRKQKHALSLQEYGTGICSRCRQVLFVPSSNSYLYVVLFFVPVRFTALYRFMNWSILPITQYKVVNQYNQT